MSLQTDKREFNERTTDGIGNPFMRNAVSSAQDSLKTRRLSAATTLGDWEQWRTLGQQIRQHTLKHLDYYLGQLADNIEKKGGHIYFAKTKEEASGYIRDIIVQKNAKKIVKSKSMVTEEIEMNHVLMEAGCELTETDLGEYILQMDDWDPPSHIVAPALHKDRTQIQSVFTEKLGYTGDESPENLARFARTVLRQKFLEADVGITGCNFAVANLGAINLVTNEGNGDLTAAIPKTHIAVMGMERIVPTLEEMEVLDNLLCRSAVGQKLTSYISVIGPSAAGETDGPEDFHLVVVDNGRSEILGSEFNEALQCIRCGACLNVCPVYRHIGGHAYGSIYPGPIGAVITPLLGGYDDYKELPFASSLCAACTDVCPVKIPLHEQLILHRQNIVKEKRTGAAERLQMKTAGRLLASQALFGKALRLANPASRLISRHGRIVRGPQLVRGWINARDLSQPVRQQDSFRAWLDKRKGGSGQ
ncbi:LutB/LldF family L-lactate oxidation iron-sulfur protein [Paenibacillus jilunlii]|uniref:Amino acid dehydrogenase n=1 Tax=Paenibacillus jilunlii TaxID=682956 RepID=A0A1G9M7R7_9BACL|nr:LutB/LldF family L-lactate oxidation iron-sulfur protein [Paenibacillus jilunlii]KWX70572.1 amino acid dehydrogenase [Paenibacillus jilunlii]SDL70174.1 L-lactate dehydrogenase complex protein LldF [Paenibacillus jilunlii]